MYLKWTNLEKCAGTLIASWYEPGRTEANYRTGEVTNITYHSGWPGRTTVRGDIQGETKRGEWNIADTDLEVLGLKK